MTLSLERFSGDLWFDFTPFELKCHIVMYIAYCYEALNEEAGRKQHRFGGEEKTLSNQAILKDKNMKHQLKGVCSPTRLKPTLKNLAISHLSLHVKNGQISKRLAIHLFPHP